MLHFDYPGIYYCVVDMDPSGHKVYETYYMSLHLSKSVSYNTAFDLVLSMTLMVH